jgi:amino acid adenylation domain-containing protein
MNDAGTNDTSGCVAVVGMAGRFPRAGNIEEFWRNVRDGIDCISRFSVNELEVSGAAERADHPDFVAARSVLDGVDLFDAGFFGMLPREAELIDPQHRVFLEICWEALEDAGYVPQVYPGAIGVFAGCAPNSYFLRNLCVDRQFIEEYTDAYQVGCYPTLLGTNADFLATRVSYKLNLSGPSLTLQTACSTSLVAVCQACQSLLDYQCDMALAGGVSITFPQKRGALYQEGGMISRDGRCRSFDVASQGTVFGSGAGVVLLKRLDDAIADGDHIEGVIRGFAINNDGSAKVGYTAPSGDGQSKVIAMAHELAGIAPDSIGYLEAHGTATPLGDPIEFAALTRAFRLRTAKKGFCALGTAKRNVGHLDIAAGVTGLINAVQALNHQQIPPAIHFTAPNPNLDLADSPFYVNTELSTWERGDTPRRAGVSAFGVGGTNAHVVVEEAPPLQLPRGRRDSQLLVLSARTARALEQSTSNLAEHLKTHPELDLGSVAYTLQSGRRAFEHRRAIVCTDVEDAVQALRDSSRRRVNGRAILDREDSVVFMFPGQGSQYRYMGFGLYQEDAGFREDIDLCSDLLRPHLGLDLRTAIYPGDTVDTAPDLQDTRLAQPALFVFEYALARLWMRWGIRPTAMIGHSVGEYVAACLAGVFSLEDALTIISERGRIMMDLAPGGMLSVRLGEEAVRPMLNCELSLAAINSPTLSVVSGPLASIEALDRELSRRGVGARRLATSHAFHSRMLDPLIEPFTEYLRQFRLNAPTIPYVSGVTGEWITAKETTDPGYWARHFREPVQFAKGLRQIQDKSKDHFLEVGPGRTLSTLARQVLKNPAEAVIIASLPGGPKQSSDRQSMLEAVGQFWVNGVTATWATMHYEGERRCSLPTYPFERTRHWIDAPPLSRPHPATTDRGNVTDVATYPTPPSMEIAMPEEHPLPIANPCRGDRIRESLRKIFADLSGVTMSEADFSSHFLELGFDSLFLTQVAQILLSRFGLKITFRQLLDRFSTLDSLTTEIDASLPAGAFCEALPAVPPPALTPRPSGESRVLAELQAPIAAAPMGSTVVEVIVREQLQAMSQLMARQLAMLQGTGVHVESPVATPPLPQLAQAASTPSPKPEPVIPRVGTESFTPFKPIQKGPVSEINAQQARYLDDLIARYSARTARSKEYTQTHRGKLADPRVAAGFRSLWKEMVYPIVVDRSSGSRLWDLDGNEYIDILNGFGPIFFGHAPEFIADAVERQLKRGFETGPQTPLAGRVADLICELTGMERVTFCNTGSEAVMAALRLSRAVTGRSKIVLFAGDYHGNFGEVLVKKIQSASGPRSMPVAPGITPEEVANATVLDYGTPESLEYIRAHANELAAVLLEPVQSRHPALQPVEFLREVRAITASSGTALIFDEVVTGFRSHPGGAQAIFGIRADLATYGKVVGGGLPIGVLAGSPRFMDALDGGMWQYGDDSIPEAGVTFFAGTFVRHPLALAAALAVLTHLKESGPELQQAVNERTGRFVADLNLFFEERGVPTHIEHFASFFYFSFPPDQRFGSLLYYHLREKGVHLQEGFPCFLTTAHSDADLEQVAQAFKQSINEMQAGGVLPAPPRRELAIPAIPTVVPAPDHHLGVEAPLTESQLEIWLSARISDEANCAYNESFTLRMRGQLDQESIRRAIGQLVNRHEALRATFDPSGTRQRFLEQVAIDTPLIDLTQNPADERPASFEQLIVEDAERPFDLIEGPLFRTMLVRLESDLHALVITAHHIICDGWSTNVLLEDLSKFYDANRRGTTAELAPPARFGSYARSNKEWTQSPGRAAVEQWWVEKFTAPVTPLDLPTDHPRQSIKSFRGDTVQRTIDSAALRRIKQFGARQGCTLFATLLTGFKILLQRLSDQADVVVGIPAAGQSLLDGEALVGHCVNFLPLRSSLEGEPTVAGLLRQVKDQLLDAYEHQSYTYGTLVRKLAVPRDPSRLPLTQTQFNLERVGSRLSLPGLDVEVSSNPKRFVNFDLFLNAVESDEGLTLDCDYCSDLFERSTVERWLDHYATLLEGMAAGADRTISTLPLLGEAEYRQIVVDWNDTRIDFPGEKCLHHLIAEQASRTPEKVAVVFEDRSLTYAELDAASNQLAHFLQKSGVRPGSPIAICVDRSMEMIVGVLGILKAGGAYVPLDPAYPSERISAVLRDSKPPVLLTEASLSADLEPLGTRIIRLDADWHEIGRESAQLPTSPVCSSDLAYLIYTSGSTGKPKGVMIPHRCVVNFLGSMARCPGLTADDTLVAVTTLAFDIAVLELFLPLTLGARVVLASREVASDGHKLRGLIDRSKATVVQATPATWRLLLEAGWSGSAGMKVLCGGEALPRDLADMLLTRASEVWNMYGPTETTVWSSVLRVEPGTGPVPVGPPIANTTFYVLDRLGRPAPIGVPGELYIGGEGVTRGYWNDPRQTAEKFVHDPFDDNPESRLYRTGDLVRYRPDRSVEFLGRLDTQVKVRGYRIETAEVESVLVQYPGVREAVVVAHEFAPGHNRLVAYLVSSQPISPGELQRFIATMLPSYMVPTAYIPLDALLRTPNGKVDRKKLPPPDASAVARPKQYVAPTSPRQQSLAEICAGVLGLERLSVEESLFDAGADSLHMFQIVARAMEVGINLSLKQILTHLSIAAICDNLEKTGNFQSELVVSGIVPLARDQFRSRRAHLSGSDATSPGEGIR